MAVGEDRGAFGDHRLRAVRLRELARPSRLPPRAQRLEDPLVEGHPSAKERGDGGLGEIVGGGSEPAARDDRPGALDPCSHRGGDLLRAVADGSAPHDTDPDRRRLPREGRRVGIDGEPQEELITDRDEFDVHGRSLASAQRTRGRPKTSPCRER